MIRQFLIESMLYAFIASVFALLLAYLCLPEFNRILTMYNPFTNSVIQKNLTLNLSDYGLFAGMIVLSGNSSASV